MRFSLTLVLKKNIFPMEYRRVILSYMKNALSNCNNGRFFEDFFGKAKQKDYCFSVVFPKSKFQDNIIQLEDNEIKILFSTDDRNKSGLKLFSAFITQKGKTFPLENGNCMVLKSINKCKHDEITNNRAIFKTTVGGGICVRDHDKETNIDRYLIYSDHEFRSQIKSVVDYELLNAGFRQDEVSDVTINAIQCKKAVAKHYSRYIDVSVGMFEISANNNILQYLYDTGIGSRKSAGFGMLDLVTQDLQ